jgi:hypothetical protein
VLSLAEVALESHAPGNLKRRRSHYAERAASIGTTVRSSFKRCPNPRTHSLGGDQPEAGVYLRAELLSESGVRETTPLERSQASSSGISFMQR